MKVSRFLIGAVVGVTGTLLLAKRQPALFNVAQDVMSDLRKKMSNVKSNNPMSQEKNTKVEKANLDHKANTSLIESIIQSDPQLKSVVADIESEASTVKH